MRVLLLVCVVFGFVSQAAAGGLQQALADLESADKERSGRARLRLLTGLEKAASRDDEKAVLAALARSAERRSLLTFIERHAAAGGDDTFDRDATRTISQTYGQLMEDERSLALRVLASIGRREGLLFLAEKLADEDGPTDFGVETALRAVATEPQNLELLFPKLTETFAFKDFRAVAVVDFANRLMANDKLTSHPAGEHLEVLAAWIDSQDPQTEGYAVSACYALSFIGGVKAKMLLEKARMHRDKHVRLEAAYARALHRVPGAAEEIAAFALDAEMSGRARSYLGELNLAHRIPPEANEPSFLARADMISWLAHPQEFNRAPDHIELWDRRTIHWPPFGDRRELFLFKYRYDLEDGTKQHGVGLVGSETFSLLGEDAPKADGTPEDALIQHCLWELEDDSRKSVALCRKAVRKPGRQQAAKRRGR